MYDLLHVAWLFKKGMEHYVEQGEQAQFDMRQMQDNKKHRLFGGAF